MTNEQKARFGHLALALEPENLYWDGERTQAQARAAYRKIIKEWRALEREVGFEVSTDDAFRWLMEGSNR
jgi:hypothetical protein